MWYTHMYNTELHMHFHTHCTLKFFYGKSKVSCTELMMGDNGTTEAKLVHQYHIWAYSLEIYSREPLYGKGVSYELRGVWTALTSCCSCSRLITALSFGTVCVAPVAKQSEKKAHTRSQIHVVAWMHLNNSIHVVTMIQIKLLIT